MHYGCFESMASGNLNVARDDNERGLANFVESLWSLLTGIQNINEQQESAEYFEEAKRRLQDAIETLQRCSPSRF